ncbi:MAG: response regulator [Hyphomicrobiaceae bacterium]
MQRATENAAMFPSGPVQHKEPKPTLLFVDDEERILRSLRMLFAANYRVLVTTSGVEALEILKRERVHALISDQRMPVMAGVDLLRQAREIAPNTMRLLLTGYSDIEAIIGSINDGEVFRYINKPWNADDIRGIVGEAAGIAMSLEQPEASASQQPPIGEAQSLLLIDDCRETAMELKTLIEESFPRTFALEWATSLGEAMAILEQKNVSIVVSEVQVGDEDMTPFLKTLKRFKPHVVTIVLTSFKDSSLLVGLINQGQVHRFLPKPMRRVMTVRGIQSGIARSREIQNRPEIAQRHKVEAPVQELPPGLISRIRGLFMRSEKALNGH